MNSSLIPDKGFSPYGPKDILLWAIVTVIIIIVAVLLLLTVVAICALFFLVKKDHVVPIFVINLHVADLIQLCSLIGLLAKPDLGQAFLCALFYFGGLLANVGFMMCVSVERYLVVAWPVWYRYKRSIRTTVLVCVIVWFFPVLVLVINVFIPSYESIIVIVFLLLPFPVLIFTLVGTLKSLSSVISVSSTEKRRIVGTLVLVLCNYTLLYLPLIILLMFVRHNKRPDPSIFIVVGFFILVSPVADLFLYVFMSKEATARFRAFLCCCRRSTTETQSCWCCHGNNREINGPV